MPVYTVKDNQTGRTIKFDWQESTPPTDQDMEQIFTEARSFQPSALPVKTDTVAPWKKTASSIYRPTLEGIGIGIGGSVGTAAAGPPGTVAGGTLGYMAGSQVADIADQALGIQKPRTVKEEALKQAGAAKKGAEFTMGGEVAGPLIGGALKAGGKTYAHLAGFLTGKGAPNVEQVFKTGFEKNVDERDLYGAIKEALGNVKETRGAVYREQLQTLKEAKEPLNISSITDKFHKLLEQYNLQPSASGQIIPKGVTPLYKTEMKNINEIAADIRKISANPQMQTPEQLDLFKRKLDNFWSENKDSRALVSSLRNTVKDLIVKNVPEYEKMTASYKKASDFLDEIGKSLTGKTGKASIDSVLKKLTLAMKEEPDYRRELLDRLSARTGVDLKSMIANVSMQPWMPVGRVGHIGGLAALYELIDTQNPKFAALMALASPRVQAEFVSVLGQAYRGVAPTLSKMPLAPYGPLLSSQLNKYNEPPLKENQ